jgi:hypothetical protein
VTFPVRTVSRPACLTGQSNGKLNGLTDTPVPYAVWPCRLVTPAARSWRALASAALASGHTLKPSGPTDSYRPYDVQEAIFRARYVRYNTGNEKRSWQGVYWWRKDGVAAAAVPGTSNHGWGLAVDVGEERDGDSGTESMDRATLDWLVANAERFGFSHEVQSEPWHIRYFSGDHIPAATLDHEATPQPTPPPVPQEDDMALLAIDTDESVWVIGLTPKPFPLGGLPAVYDALVKKGSPVIEDRQQAHELIARAKAAV